MENLIEVTKETNELSAEAVEELKELEFVFAWCGLVHCGKNIGNQPSKGK